MALLAIWDGWVVMMPEPLWSFQAETLPPALVTLPLALSQSAAPGTPPGETPIGKARVKNWELLRFTLLKVTQRPLMVAPVIAVAAPKVLPPLVSSAKPAGLL